MFGQVITIGAVQLSLKDCEIKNKEIKEKVVKEKKSSKKVKGEESEKIKEKKSEESCKVGDFHKNQVEEPGWCFFSKTISFTINPII